MSAGCRWWRCGRGQPRCRGALLRTYGGRCAITGTAVASVLEAAHIWPLKGEHTNGIWNGLLLRADLHTLFDLFLLTVDADSLEVRVSPALQDTEYAALDGRLLTAPPTQGDQPAREALVKHNEDCAGWLST